MRLKGRSRVIAVLGGVALMGSVIAAPPVAATPSVVATISLGASPFSVTTTSGPGLGKVYVGTETSHVLEVNPNTNAVDDSVQVDSGSNLVYVTASPSDDSYVYAAVSGPNTVSKIRTVDDTLVATYSTGVSIGEVAVATSPDGLDDTLYVASNSGVIVLDAVTMTRDDTIRIGASVTDVAVAGDDSIVAITNTYVYVIDPATDDSIRISAGVPKAVAVSPDDRYAYVTSLDASTLLNRIDTRTGVVDDSLPSAFGKQGIDVAVAPNGTIYIATSGGGGYSLMEVDPVSFETVWSVPLSQYPRGLAVGPTGLVYAGVQSGPLTVINPSSSPSPSPTPSPVFPPDAPRDVKAVAGNAEATVSWTAPASSGSFPISNYLARSTPGGKTCLVAAPTLTCTVAGLTNGTAYTFTVEALNGAGWSSPSLPSAAVTPTRAQSIVITGSRDAADPRLILVKGTSSGLAGSMAVPFVRLPGQTEYSEGTGTRTIDVGGRFEWQRKTGKKAYVYFMSGDVKSNTVVIDAR